MTHTFLKQHRAALAGVLLAIFLAPLAVRGEDTNTVELIRQLQKRIDELEHKVKVLEEGKANAVVRPSAPATAVVPAEPGMPEIETGQTTNRAPRAEDAVSAAEGFQTFTNAWKYKDFPRVSIGPDGLWVGSPDGAFLMELRGILQVDSRSYLDSPAIAGNDGLLLRRARPILQGTLYRDFDFMFVPDFAPSTPTIFDALVNYEYSPGFQIMAGKFKTPIGLEQLVSDRNTFFNERSLATDLVPNRDIGIELHGDLLQHRISYAGGVFNGSSDGGNSPNTDFANTIAFMGRLFFQPFAKSVDAIKQLGLGVAGSYESASIASINGLPSNTGGTLPGYYTDGQLQFFAYNPADKAVIVAQGDHWRISPQAYYYLGPFGVMAEYVISDQEVQRTLVAPFSSAHLLNNAWEVTGSWILTGEKAGYNSVISPKHPFNPSIGEWGAVRLVARYMQLNVDSAAFPLYSNPMTSAGSATAWSAGLSWYLNRNVSMNLDYTHTWFNGGGGPGIIAPATVTRNAENVIFTRIQLAF